MTRSDELSDKQGGRAAAGCSREHGNIPTAAAEGADSSAVATRRHALKAAAGAALALSLPQALVAQAATPVSSSPAKALFFTTGEFQLADELAEMIIPADEHSPGARAAQCAAYIDARLAEALDPGPRELWRDGLRRIDATSFAMHGKRFLEASSEQRAAVLARIAANEQAPQSPEELFFADLKARTADAYYSSEVGIHSEMDYKGNVPITEFAGYDAKSGVLE